MHILYERQQIVIPEERVLQPALTLPCYAGFVVLLISISCISTLYEDPSLSRRLYAVDDAINCSTTV